MFTYEYRFYPKTFCEPDITEFDDRMQWFLSCLYKNGQILPVYQNTVEYEACYACRVVAYERDLLSERYGNQYTVQFLKAVEEMSVKPVGLIYVGKTMMWRIAVPVNHPATIFCLQTAALTHLRLFAGIGEWISAIIVSGLAATGINQLR